MHIGNKIKNLRKSRKMRQEDFAEKIGVSRSTLSCYEIGQRTPSLKTLSGKEYSQIPKERPCLKKTERICLLGNVKYTNPSPSHNIS